MQFLRFVVQQEVCRVNHEADAAALSLHNGRVLVELLYLTWCQRDACKEHDVCMLHDMAIGMTR